MDEKQLQKLHRKLKGYLEINKKIIVFEGTAEVIASNLVGQKPNDLDYKKDYLLFCVTKFSKSLKAILTLMEKGLNEDALILTRSNYECMIHAKALVNNGEMINHFVHYKLGLENEKYYKFVRNKDGYLVRSKIVETNDSNLELDYYESIRKIAVEAKEEISYKHVYRFLCEITHCNFLTSGYYREKVWYNIDIASEEARTNVLLCNIGFVLKLYEVIIESQLLDDEEKEIEDTLASIVITDTLILQKCFEVEEKRIINIIKNDIENEEMLKKYLDSVHQFKMALLVGG